jgi:hypothetical protein
LAKRINAVSNLANFIHAVSIWSGDKRYQYYSRGNQFSEFFVKVAEAIGIFADFVNAVSILAT